MSKRLLSLTIFAGIVLLLPGTALFAGGQKESTTAAGTASARTPVVYWGDWGGEGQKQFDTMMTKFNNDQTKYEAKYVVTQDVVTKFLTAAAAGNPPDLVFWDRWRTVLYAPKGVIMPINSYMTRDGVSESQFFSEAIRELSYKGKLYGLPLTVDNRSLFYNKKYLAEAGVTPPTTWAQLESDAKKLTVWNGDKLVRAGFSLQDTGLFNMWLQQAGGRMVTPDGSHTAFNSPQGLEVLNFWSKLLNVDKVYKVGFEAGLGEGTDAFATGKEAMLYSGPWMLSTYEKYGKDLQFGIVPPPAGPNGDKGGIIGGFGLIIPSGAKHKEGAWALMKWWLADPQNAAYYGKMSLNIPALKSATLDTFYANDPLYKPFLETMKFAKIRPPYAGYSTMEEQALIPQLQLFLEGKVDAKTALKTAQEMGDKILAQAQNQ